MWLTLNDVNNTLKIFIRTQTFYFLLGMRTELYEVRIVYHLLNIYILHNYVLFLLSFMELKNIKQGQWTFLFYFRREKYVTLSLKQ